MIKIFVPNDIYNRCGKQIRIQFLMIVLYMLCMISVPGGNAFALISRYVILPVLAIVGLIGREERANRPDYVTPILFIVAVLPSILFSDYMSNASIKAATVLLLFLACSFYYSKYNQNSVESLFYALLIYAVLDTLFGLGYFVSGLGFLGGYFRGYYGNRNAATAAYVIDFVVLFANYSKDRKKWCLLLAVASAFLILQTQSRGGFMGLVVGLVSFLFLNTPQKSKFILKIGAIVLLIFLFKNTFLNFPVVDRIINEGLVREDLWNFAINLIKNNFYIGVGFSSSALSNTMAGTEGMNFHNSYIAMMADVGLWGVCFFAIMFIRMGIKIYSNSFIIDGYDKVFFCALSSIGLAFFALSFGESYLMVAGSSFSFVFWCCMFCLSQTSGETRKELWNEIQV